jgi:short subunit dehydrogenase-like uncharacterized protein
MRRKPTHCLIFLVRVLTLVSFLAIKAMSLSHPTSFAARKYDLVIYGATGFTGQIAAAYVHQHYPTLKWALAGRNRVKLEQVRSAICGSGASASTIPIIVADAVEDPASLQELVANTKVIANYAGTPFIDKALPVVEACAKHGTCYTDITGEVPFQRASYDRYVL